MLSLARIGSLTTNMRLFVTCLLAIGFADLVIADEPEKLVNAKPAGYGEFSYLASIRVNTRHRCGGTIITRQHILTAAHCLDNVPLFLFTVVTGTNFATSHCTPNCALYNGVTHNILKAFQHEKYQQSKPPDYDIAVIKLIDLITLNPFQNIINLPSVKQPYNIMATVGGWGSLFYKYSGSTDWLRTLSVRTLDFNRCQAMFRHLLPDHITCGQSTAVGSGVCDGDSGSPLVYNGQAIGIVSGGILCAKGVPDLYVDVSQFLDFIIEKVSI